MKINLEKSMLFIIILLYFALQTNALFYGHYAGQDFQRHKLQMEESADDPISALTHSARVENHGVATLYHFIGGRLLNLIGKCFYLKYLAFIQIILNIFALLLFYKLMQRIIYSQIIRMNCFCLITFLPAFVIPSLVIAADAMTNFLFIVIVWHLIWLKERSETLMSFIPIMMGLALLLFFAFNIKFNLGSCIGAVFLLLTLFYLYKTFNFKRYVLAVVVIVMIPMSIIFLQYNWYIKKQMPILNESRTNMTHMTLRSLIFFRKTDQALLNARYFHEYRYIKEYGYPFQPMLRTNYFSYPGLLHVALFTDIMNIYQPNVSPQLTGRDHYYHQIRSAPNQKKMSLAVKTGVPFFLGLILVVPYLVLSEMFRMVFRKKSFEYPLVVLMLLSGTYYLATVINLPFISQSYSMGYWLPRLVMPALISFFILLFVGLDKWLLKQSLFYKILLTAIVVFQSYLHFSFLWT